jgi:hypothetical protein
LSEIDEPKDAKFEEANSRLTEGLKACRSIVNSYRAMIGGGPERGVADGQPELPQVSD